MDYVPTEVLTPRHRRAELRAAVLRAHPDHGGSREALEVALRALRADSEAPGRPPARSQRAARPRRPPPRPAQPPPQPHPGWSRLALGLLGKVAVGYALFLTVGLAFGFGLMWLQHTLLGM